MLKKIVLCALTLIPMSVFSQEVIAYFNSAEVITAMPEYKHMQDSLEKTQKAFEAEMSVMSEEYEKKYTAFMAQADSLIDSIKTRRLAEIQDLEERANNYRQLNQQTLQQIQQSLFVPIQQKVKAAIEVVGSENNFAYIIDAQALLYVNPKSVDATPLVKKKLGI